MTILYHYTCGHAHQSILEDGVLRPWAYGLVWLTDLDVPMREPLGLTSYLLSCDRTEHRYLITDDRDCHRWVTYPKRDRSIEIDGTKPMHWWVSERPVPVIYDPIGALI